MKVHGYKRSYSNLFWVNLRNHFCPDCDEVVNVTTDSKIVNSKSPEAKDYDFSDAVGETNMAGNIKFIWTVFECPVCKRRFSVKEMKQIEKDEKGKRPESAYRKKKLGFSELLPVFAVILVALVGIFGFAMFVFLIIKSLL